MGEGETLLIKPSGIKMSSKSRESPLPYDEVKKNKLQGDFPKEIAKSRTKPAKTQRAKPEKMGSSNSGKALKLFRHASAKLELQESIEKVIENKKAQLIETSPAKRKQHEKSLSAMRKLYWESTDRNYQDNHERQAW